MRPVLGAARISQAMAPRNGGVTNEAITAMRTKPRAGMSVRATSQASGVAIRQDRAPTASAMPSASRNDLRRVGSVNSASKLPSVKPPSWVASE